MKETLRNPKVEPSAPIEKKKQSKPKIPQPTGGLNKLEKFLGCLGTQRNKRCTDKVGLTWIEKPV